MLVSILIAYFQLCMEHSYGIITKEKAIMIFFSVLVLNMMFVIYSECISTPVELEKYARPGTVGIEPTTFPPTRWDIFQARPVWTIH
jgi:hypothetical protein